MPMSRTVYQLIGFCLAEAFNECIRQQMELSQDQAGIIIDSFCNVLKKDRQEFKRDLFIDGILTAAASLEEPETIGSSEPDSIIC